PRSKQKLRWKCKRRDGRGARCHRRGRLVTVAARKPASKPSPLAVFIARAEARALLWQAGEFNLHEAVDELWAIAHRAGLVAELGADRVQHLLAEAFAPVRDDLPKFREIEAEDAGDNWQTLGQTAARVVEKIPIATLQAADYLVQQGDAERFRNWLD